jgi:hypothetical protein
MHNSRRLGPLIIALVASAVAVPAASPHLVHTNGTWTYRYYDRDPATSFIDCASGSNPIDPMNLVFWQYGEYSRINSHIETETHLGFFTGHSPHDMCATNDGGSSYWGHDEFDEQQGHGCLTHCSGRAHMRLWYAPHSHGANVDKWTAAGVHHEEVVCCFSHEIDEDWETWEDHIASEMYAHHNIYWDAYFRGTAGYYRGWYDDGFATRVGGLHDGQY